MQGMGGWIALEVNVHTYRTFILGMGFLITIWLTKHFVKLFRFLFMWGEL